MKALFISIAIIIGIAATAVYYPIQTDATLTGEGTVESPLSVAASISTGTAVLAGRSGGQTLIGGTGTTDDLILQSTSGVGATGALIQMKVGNNGGTTAMQINNDGSGQFFSRFNIGTLATNLGQMVVRAGTDQIFGVRDWNTVLGDGGTGIAFQSFNDLANAEVPFLIAGSKLSFPRGKVGVGTTSGDKVMEINLGTTDALRLSYNDANGSAANYMDVTLSSVGSPTFNATGTSPMFTFSDPIIIKNGTPSSAGDTGTAGQIAWDASYLYICTATNTWTRIALAW